MTKRIFRYILACALIIFFTTTISLFMFSYRVRIDEYKEHLIVESEYIVEGIEREGEIYLKKLPSNDDFVLVIDEKKIYSNKQNYEVYLKHLDYRKYDYISDKLLDGTEKNTIIVSSLWTKIIFHSKLLDNGKTLCLITGFDSIYATCVKFIAPIIISIMFLVFLSAFVSMRIAKKITNPINTINLENPSKSDIYEELSPFISRITGQNKQISSYIKDIKQQQQAFKTITSNMEEGLFLLNNKGEILSYNGGALDCMGITTPPTNKNILVLNRSESFRKCVEGALSGKHYEKVVEMNDRVYHVFANAVWEEDVVAGVVLMLIDVTEREQREALRREFSANVSHELKTPLTSISGFAEIMKNGMVKEEDMQNFAGKIYDESQRLINLVQDIIKISKLDEEGIIEELDKELIDVDKIIKETIERLQPIAKKEDITIKYHSQQCEIMGINQMIQEMVYNLCDNAIRYNKKGGQIKINLKNKTSEMLLTVEDTGIGIKKKNQSRIFERFYRASESRSKIIDGTGLGLAIVKHSVLFHRGSINVESHYGKGTKIRVHIPKK